MNRLKKILIMGLPGAGKSTLAKALAQRLNAVHLNADEIRTEINKGLGFSLEDRIEHGHIQTVDGALAYYRKHFAAIEPQFNLKPTV
jgi:adenylylsulfate kinase-like enzyme